MVASVVCYIILCASQENIPNDVISEEELRTASTELLQDPTGKEALKHATTIGLFILNNQKVVLHSEEAHNWIKDHEYEAILLAAYSAGSIQSQLCTGVKRDDLYSGLLTLFSAYRNIQVKKPEFKVEKIDELYELHKKNKLMDYVIEIEKKRGK